MIVFGIPPLTSDPLPSPGRRLWRALVRSLQGTLDIFIGDH